MKFLFSILLFATCFLHTATAKEVTYFEGSWAETKAKAKAENKYIFVDCYTDWCRWCKVMDKETMPDADVISLMNEKFVAAKIDMEHGEGVKLAMKYHIMGFPTFMVFNPAGEYVYTIVGYQKPKEFIEELNNALNKSKQFALPGLSADIDIDFPEFYKQAYAGRGKSKQPAMTDVTAFLDKQTDLFSEISWGVISRFPLDEKYSKHFFSNIEKYKQLYGNDNVENKVNATLLNMERTAVKNKSNKEFEEVLRLIDKYVKKDQELTKMNLRLDYYKGVEDWNKFMEAFDEYIIGHGYEDANFINSLCWDMYEHCNDKKALVKACAYMGKAVAKEPMYANMDTYAAILYKSGQLAEAETWANKAIATGKTAGDKTESTEDLLKKISEAKSGNTKKARLTGIY